MKSRELSKPEIPPLGRPSPVLDHLAARYESSKAGKTGAGQSPRWLARDELFSAAGCASGEGYDLAWSDLRRAETADAIEVQKRRGEWLRFRVTPDRETGFYQLLGRPSPSDRRAAWVGLFTEAENWQVPENRRAGWRVFCRDRAHRVTHGEGFDPLSRKKLLSARVQLKLITRLLAWNRPCLLRTVSALLCHDSKRLGLWRGTLEKLLREATGGGISGLADLGIEDNPSSVRLFGPLRLVRGEGGLDYAAQTGEFSIADADLAQAESIATPAPRCVTVENPTTFHELVRLQCGDLFVCTSYPNEATVRFLKLLPDRVELFHFGDTDPWGFDVLLCLREKTSRPIRPLHMHHRSHPEATPLTDRDRRKLQDLRGHPQLMDVQSTLDHLAATGSRGDFEQERLPIDLAEFPYSSNG